VVYYGFETTRGGHVAANTPCASGEYDPELWFPLSDKDTTVHVAVALCHDCPVKATCLAGALARGERDGVWGGQFFGRSYSRATAAVA